MEAALTRGDNLALARRLFASFTDNDTEGILELLAPDVRARPSVGGGPLLEGRAAVSEWLTGFRGPEDEFEVRPLDYEVVGNCVIVRGYLRHREQRMLTERPAFWLFEIVGEHVVRMESCATRDAALARCA